MPGVLSPRSRSCSLSRPMTLTDTDRTELRELEIRLLQPLVRSSPTEVAKLLADDFLEFGTSGRTYNKQQVVASLAEETPLHSAELVDFQARALAPDVALISYRTITRLTPDSEPVHALRSSIWSRSGGRWQLTFHQGTSTSHA